MLSFILSFCHLGYQSTPSMSQSFNVIRQQLKNPVVGSASVFIKSTPTIVFEFIGINFFSNYPRWSPEVIKLEQIGEGNVMVGTQGRQVRVDQGRRLESSFEVTTFEPKNLLVFDGTTDPFRCTFKIEPSDNQGKVKLSFIFAGLELYPFMRPFEKLIRHVVQNGAERTTRNIKRLVEIKERRESVFK